MAEIHPLRAWRYNPERFSSIDELTSPLFDVVTEKYRQELYRTPYNSIHLSVPAGGEGAAQRAAQLAEQWKREGILVQDPLPGIYVYYQYFTIQGSSREFVRKGFVCNIRAYDWDDKVLLRHENTIPKAVNDRLELLHETQLNVSPTHGLYTDPHFELEQYMDESMQLPLYESEDYQGVRDCLSVIHDAKIIRRFQEVLAQKQVILADGHHRYEGSLLYRQQRQQQNPEHSGLEGYNFHLMYFTNTESDDIRIQPTHRLISGIEGLTEEKLLQKLEPYFFIKPLDSPYDINTIILGKKWAFGLVLKDSTYKIRLKPEVLEQMKWPMPDEVKHLDLTVLHHFVIEKRWAYPAGSSAARSTSALSATLPPAWPR
ncbi:DUF1015 domain-containing protein [Cesiribacter andamanensis]|uniref:DUF1015 domain-containing protein n=1 Tax=Cesiribacter andamanensis AMV16 TaxID=1279009 RepID=M7N2B9_9BACT|nr:DUF1015 domain-containing protein [Cesiribacter andamanensis]EMR02803.1 hypothetical protein ADICEAN_02078 [Cesiribacter andamanensis AMV16]